MDRERRMNKWEKWRAGTFAAVGLAVGTVGAHADVNATMQAIIPRVQTTELRQTQPASSYISSHDVSAQLLQPVVPVELSQPQSVQPVEVFCAPERKTLQQNASLGEFIQHFDQQWQKEGLPRDWYNLSKKEGFSMQTQMHLLQELNPAAVAKWSQQTKQDILGFALEYLSNKVVYPYKYYLDSQTGRLEDKKYGNKDIVETTSEKERNGSVKQSLQHIKQFFLADQTPDGSMIVMPSPAGPSGLTTDDGKPIDYPDTHWFVMRKENGWVNGFTIKTDFSLRESREVIRILTGKELDANAPIEEYVNAVAYITPTAEKPVRKITEIVDILKTVRQDERVFKNKQFTEVYADMQQGEALYSFNDKTQAMIKEFEEYVSAGIITKETMQKALAATILRISKLFLVDKKQEARQYQQRSKAILYEPYQPEMTYGAVLRQVAAIPGCAGGGSITAVPGVVARVGVVENMNYTGENAKKDPTLCVCIAGKSKPHFHCPGVKRTKENEIALCRQAIIVGDRIATCPSCGAGKVCA